MQTATAFLLSCLLTALCGCSGHNGNAVRDYQNMAHREGWHRLPASCFLTPDGQPALQYSLLRQHPSLTLTEKRDNRQPVTLSWNNGKLAVACRNTAAIAMPSCGRMVLFTVRQDGIVRYQDKKDGIPQQTGGGWDMLIAVHGNTCLICWNRGAGLPASCRPEQTASPRYYIFTMEKRKGPLAPVFSLIPHSGSNTQP